MNGSERRKNPRYVVDVEGQLKVGDASINVQVRDICRDAALVESDRWFPLETEATLDVALPGSGGPIDVKGRVIRITPGDQGSHGMALLFDDLSATAGMRIDFFLSQQEG